MTVIRNPLIRADNNEANQGLDFERLSDVVPKDIEWLWSGRIPKGMTTIIEGDGGRGKSTIVTDICSRLSAGRGLPGDNFERSPMKILMMTVEDDKAVVLSSRFAIHGANLKNILICDEPVTLNPESIAAIKETIHREGVEVLVIDPIVSYFGRGLDMNKANDVRSVLQMLHILGKETGCTIIVVRHFNKSRDGSASQRGAGSVDFRNAVRSVLQVIHDPNEEQSYLVLEKSNYASGAPAFLFQIVDKQVVWGEQKQISADTLHSRANNRNRISALDEAMDFLKESLVSPRMCKEVEERARECGISPRTLVRASANLKVIKKKTARGSMWTLPQVYQESQECQH